MPPLMFLAAGVGVTLAAIAVYGQIMKAMSAASTPVAEADEPEPTKLVYDPASDTWSAPRREG